MSGRIISGGKRKALVLKGILAGAALCVAAPACFASAFVGGAYYQLGDADPGAAAGQQGNSITRDTFSGAQDLSRLETPRYSSDVPARGPLGDKLSMQFANEGLGGPAFPGSYGRLAPLDASQQGIVLEAWVKIGPSGLDQPDGGPGIGPARQMVIAHDQGPNLGLWVHGGDYVARVGSFERLLGPAEVGAWHHLAYVRNFSTSSYYYDGNLVATNDKDPLPAPAVLGSFWVGGINGAPSTAVNADLAGNTVLGFNGWIDEVRYQTFNPLAAGAFEPTAFLISPVPEPTALGLLALAGGATVRRRRRR
jgi:hypothetical protein